MNIEITNASPRNILTGVDDKSTTPQVYEQLNDSQHAPLFLLMTKRGDTDVKFVNSSMFNAIYGYESLEKNSIYHTHQTEGIKAAFRAGNASIAVKRIVGPEASCAKLDFSLIPFDNGEDEITYKVGVQQEHENDPHMLQGEPIITFKAGNVGDYGNNLRVCITAAPDNIQRLKSAQYNGFVYELWVEEFDTSSKVSRPVYTQYRDTSVLFTLNPDDRLGHANPYSLCSVVEDMYTDETLDVKLSIDVPTLNLDVLYRVHELVGEPNTSPWDYDILAKGGLTMGHGIARPLSGGSDGFSQTLSGYVSSKVHLLEQYDTAVRQYFESMSNYNPIGDMAKYPISIVYDTGFSLKTKLSMTNILALRRDVAVGLSTFCEANIYQDDTGEEVFRYSGTSTLAEAINIAVRLRTAFSLLPESEVYGTPAMRAFITMQSGIYENSDYPRRQSIIIDIIEKISRYIGAGDKIWKTNYAIDESPNNELRGWSNVNYTYRPQNINEVAWDAGIIWVDNKNTNTLFYPSFQTIYPDDTSIFNNVLTMLACCYLNKVAHLTWAMTAGDNNLADDEIAETISNIVERETRGKFDNRFKIDATTVFTRADKARGYSWSTSINLYATTAKTVATYKITSNRMS